MEHRIGGLEKEDGSGNVSHDSANHERMVMLRQKKIEGIANDIPLAVVEGDQQGETLLLSWGSTYGAARTAFEKLKANSTNISFLHLRHLNPFPKNVGEILNRFSKVIVPELNSGHLQWMLQAKFLKPITGIHKIQGRPFKSVELVDKITALLTEKEVTV
jgi:2-oxoglutarate ferredoxin oxidoreductase subunit alpha